MKAISLKLYLLTSFFFIFLNILTAQPPSLAWVKTASSSSAVGITLDRNNAVVVAGVFSGTVDFDAGNGIFNLASNGNRDIYITKYTPNGNFIWGRSIGGSPDDNVEAIKTDRQGNLYLIGRYQSTVDFDPGPGVFNVATTGGSNTFILKLDKDANFMWVKTFRGFSNTLDIDHDGNILSGGYFSGTVDFDPGIGIFNMTASFTDDDMFVLKLDSAGNFLWARQIVNNGGSNHQQFGLETDPSGNIFFSGNFTNSMDFDPGSPNISLTANGSDDVFILKLNAQGDYQWAKQLGGTGSDKAFGLEVDTQGNVFTTGYFTGTADFDPGASTFLLTAPTIRRCAFISKLDGSGNFIYAKNFQSGESFGQALAIDGNNNIYISGGFHNTVDFDPGPGNYNIDKGDLFTIKLDQDGSFVWAGGYTPPPTVFFESIYSSIVVDTSSNVYFAGSFTSTVDFDPGVDSFPVTANDLWDMFVLKLGPAPCNNPSTSFFSVQNCGDYTFNGETFTSAGRYYQLLDNAAGCDSIVQLDLTFTTKYTNLELSACDKLLWNGRTLDTSGIYADTISLANGCDSIVILTLTIKDTPPLDLGADSIICPGDSIQSFAGSFNAYLWSTGSSAPYIVIKEPGIYWVNVTGANGCSTSDTLNITPSGNCSACTDPALIEKIYPTPFNGSLTIKIKSSLCVLKLDMYNALGQLLMKGISLQAGTNAINTSKLPAGMYFYRIYNGTTILGNGKVLKQ